MQAGDTVQIMTQRTPHTITLERGRALLHALKRVDSPAEREAMAELAQLRRRWCGRTCQHAYTFARSVDDIRCMACGRQVGHLHTAGIAPHARRPWHITHPQG